AALEVAPRSAKVHEALGITYDTMCDDDHAVAHYQRAMDIDPAVAERAGLLIVTIALHGGRVVVADEVSRRLVETHDDADTELHRGAALLRQDRLDEARAAFGRSLSFSTRQYRQPWQEAAAI